MLTFTPHRQLIKHDATKGQYGDCFRTCIASLMGLHPSLVPHWFDIPKDAATPWDEVRAWLREQGFNLFITGIISENQADGGLTKQDVLDWLAEENPGVFVILGGKSPKGADHSVITVDGKIVHDPAGHDPPGDAITGPASNGWWWIKILTPVVTMETAE